MSVNHSITAERFKSLFKLDDLRKPTGECEVCGNRFYQNIGKGARKRFCGASCRTKAYAPHIKPRPKEEHQERACIACGKPYVGCRESKYCSTACWPKVVNVKKVELSCERCAAPFTRNADESFRRFCSRDCARQNNVALAHQAPKELVGQQCRVCEKLFCRLGESALPLTVCSEECKNRTYRLTCVRCWEEFESKSKKKSYCSDACHNASLRKPTLAANLECKECGKVFAVEKNATKIKWCSKACQKRVGKRTRRALKKNAYVEPVHLAALIRRDLGVCQICKTSVDLAATVPDDKAPTVDHVIPLSKGGEHSYANTQLAHFLCNSYKNDSLDTLF